MSLDAFIFALEILGTIAFAMSGVMTAKARHMDIFGSLILGCTAAVGGGVIRDLILGVTPPMMFRNPVYVAAAAATSIVVFLFEYIRQRLDLKRQAAARPAGEEADAYVKDLYHGAAAGTAAADYTEVYHSARTDLILNVADTIGLAAFVAVGTETGFDRGYADNLFLCVFVGTVTGIGGGILRDMMAGEIPLILRRHVYGLAAIIGSLAYCGMIVLGKTSFDAALVSMAVTCLVRYLAIHYRLNLPAFR